MNGIDAPRFLPHKWGDALELEKPHPVGIATDVLIYTKEYPDLAETIRQI